MATSPQAVADSAVADSAVAEPAVAEPAVAEPTVAEPTVAEPAVAESSRAVSESARAVAATVLDPELPLLTLADLGVLREVSDVDGRVVVTITPTYSGCPAMQTMRDDLRRALAGAGFTDVEVRTSLSPAWSTDWITDAGRAKLTGAGIAPPGAAPTRPSGPVPLTLQPIPHAAPCPRCGSPDTVETSRFGATACKSLRRCRSCDEPYEHIKAI